MPSAISRVHLAHISFDTYAHARKSERAISSLPPSYKRLCFWHPPGQDSLIDFSNSPARLTQGLIAANLLDPVGPRLAVEEGWAVASRHVVPLPPRFSDAHYYTTTTAVVVSLPLYLFRCRSKAIYSARLFRPAFSPRGCPGASELGVAALYDTPRLLCPGCSLACGAVWRKNTPCTWTSVYSRCNTTATLCCRCCCCTTTALGSVQRCVLRDLAHGTTRTTGSSRISWSSNVHERSPGLRPHERGIRLVLGTYTWAMAMLRYIILHAGRRLRRGGSETSASFFEERAD